jgi:hypothetical protein
MTSDYEQVQERKHKREMGAIKLGIVCAACVLLGVSGCTAVNIHEHTERQKVILDNADKETIQDCVITDCEM